MMKVGMRLSCSNLSLQMAMHRPRSAKLSETRRANSATHSGWAMEKPVNSAATSHTIAPTMRPRKTAARVKARISSTAESGATSRSTMVPCILAMNIDEAVLRKVFWIRASITNPGTMKRT